jgi:AraC-like DNA-binding protein
MGATPSFGNRLGSAMSNLTLEVSMARGSTEAPGRRNLGVDTYRRLRRARTFIDDCYDQPLDLDQISREACLSRYHFLRLFRETFERTPHQYLIERRIQKAKELLTCTRLSVTDVCFEVGFESLGSFSTLFHKHVGRPPITYRARMFDFKRFPQKQIPGCFLFMYGVDISRPQF